MWLPAACNRFAATFLRAFTGSRIRPFITIGAPAGSDRTAWTAQPMSNCASESWTRAGRWAPIIKMEIGSGLG